MLIISQELRNEIEAHGIATYPNEGCGLLLGEVQDAANLVGAVFPVANNWQVDGEKPFRFRISDEDMLKAELAAADLGLDVIGIFHSHPDHPPIASPRDLAWAAWPGYSYLITEIRDGQRGQSRSWQLRHDRSGFYEEEIELGE